MRGALRHRTLSLAAVALAVFGFAATAAADPLVVTSGGYGFDTGDPFSFGVSGDGFALGWAGWQGPSFDTLQMPNACLFPCTPTVATVDLSTSLLGMTVDARHFTQQVGAVTYDALTLAGDMIFTSTPFTFPATSGEPTLHLTAPFTFSGHLTAVADPGSPPVFDADLAGAGTARLLVGHTCANADCSSVTSQYSFMAIDYRFEDVSATPEPTTMLLLGAGLLAIGGPQVAREKRRSTR